MEKVVNLHPSVQFLPFCDRDLLYIAANELDIRSDWIYVCEGLFFNRASCSIVSSSLFQISVGL